MKWASQMALVVKNLAANSGDKRDTSSIPGSGRSSGEGNGNQLQYSCLGNPRDREAWWPSVHGIAKSCTRVKCSTHVQFTCCDLTADMKWNSESWFCSLTLYPNVALHYILSFYSHSVSGYHKNTLSKWAYFRTIAYTMISQVALVVKTPPGSTGDINDEGSIPGSGRSPGGEHGNPLQYSCLENFMDRGARWTTVQGSRRVRHDWSDLAHMHATYTIFLLVVLKFYYTLILVIQIRYCVKLDSLNTVESCQPWLISTAHAQ